MWVFVVILSVACAGLLVWIGVLHRQGAHSRKLIKELIESRENERLRLASELHDSLGQNLLIIKSRAQMGLASAVNSNTAKQLAEIGKVCASTIDEARHIARNLGPRYLPQLGLTEALDAMIDRVADSTPIRFQRKLDKVDDLFSDEAALHVYRIVQESLNNLVKHAKASEARVILEREARQTRLRVEDNGQGFDPSRLNGRSSDGLGMAELRERVRILNGQLEIRALPSSGTRISVTLPTRELGRNLLPLSAAALTWLIVQFQPYAVHGSPVPIL